MCIWCEKCFNSLWIQECKNDLYDLGFKSDKLPSLFLENVNAKIAVKTPCGITLREDIRNVVMQGTVWAGLMCTATMNSLGKHVYCNHNKLAYKYKGSVPVPPLEMVDEIWLFLQLIVL